MKTRRQTRPTQRETDRQPEGGSGKTGRAENSERDPAFLTWGAGKKGERQKGEQRKREGGMKGEDGREGR